MGPPSNETVTQDELLKLTKINQSLKCFRKRHKTLFTKSIRFILSNACYVGAVNDHVQSQTAFLVRKAAMKFHVQI